MRDQIGWFMGRKEGESYENNVLIGEDILGSGRNLVQGNLPGIHKDDCS